MEHAAPPLEDSAYNSACADPDNGIPAGACTCKEGSSKEECELLGAAVGIQVSVDTYCHVVDCGHAGLTQMPTLPATTTKLNLQNNLGLKDLPLGSLDALKMATNLYVSSIGVDDLHSGVFANMASLAALELSITSITRLAAGAFDGLTALTSLSFFYNAFWTTIEKGGLRGLASLKELSFRSNKLLSLPSFDSMPALERLIVANSGAVNVLPPSFFARLPRLESVIFEHNSNLFSIPPGTFTGGSNLKSLSISGSPRLLQLEPNGFQGLSGLLDLKLLFCGIIELGPSVFRGLVSLLELTLDLEHLVSADAGALSALGSLHVLTIKNAGKLDLPATFFFGSSFQFQGGKGSGSAGNRTAIDGLRRQIVLQGLAIRNFTFLSFSMVSEIMQISELEVSCMEHLKTIPPDAFAAVASTLSTLILNNNGVDLIEKAAFRGLSRLRMLELRGNIALQSLNADVLNGMGDHAAESVRFDLRGNGLKSISTEVLSFETGYLESLPLSTIISVSSYPGTYLDVCCSYEWLSTNPHFVLRGLECNNTRETSSGVVDLDGITNWGCCFPYGWQQNLEEIERADKPGTYEDLSASVKGHLRMYCANASWSEGSLVHSANSENSDTSEGNAIISRACDTAALREGRLNSEDRGCPALQPEFEQAWVSTMGACVADECPPGFRKESNGRRHLIDCEPFFHTDRLYSTSFAVAEEGCIPCSVQHCKRCNGPRVCSVCEEGHSLYTTLSDDSSYLIHSCVEACADFGHFESADGICETLTSCVAGQEEAMPPTEDSDRICETRPRLSDGDAVAISVTAAVVLLLLAAGLLKYRERLQKLKPVDFKATLEEMIHSGKIDKLMAEYAADNSLPTEIHRKDVELGHKIGGGNFGDVFHGLLKMQGTQGSHQIDVAVKCTKASLPQGKFAVAEEELLEEAMVMSLLSSDSMEAANICSLIGVVTGGEGPTLVLVTYCAHGSLLSALCKQAKLDPELAFSVKIRTAMAEQVCAGMMYLASHLVVHRDLAARNIMVDAVYRAKVADFGLSRLEHDSTHDLDESVSSEDVYYRSSAGCFPVRWTCPVAMQKLVFNERTDVWSFGTALSTLIPLPCS